MTPKQADQIIANGNLTTVDVISTTGSVIETFTALFVKRDKRFIETVTGEKFERATLKIR